MERVDEGNDGVGPKGGRGLMFLGSSRLGEKFPRKHGQVMSISDVNQYKECEAPR